MWSECPSAGRGGATRRIECPLPLTAPDLRRTPAAAVEQVRALATEQTDEQIADTLNGQCLRTGTGLPFSRRAHPHAPRSVRHQQLRRAPDRGALADRTADGPAARRASGHRQALRAPRRAARRCAPTTRARYSSNHRPDRCPPPIRGNGYATGSSTQSLYLKYRKKRRSMKPETCRSKSPTEPIDSATPDSRQRAPKASDVYWQPWSE